MSEKYDVRSGTCIKWRKEYRRYRAGRLRLYICMILLMLFILLAIVCTSFLFKNSFNFHSNEYELNKGDMRAVEVPSLLCESIVVKKASFNRRIFVVSSVKRYKDSKQSMSSDVVLLRRDRFWYRSFYLLKGSTVRMRLSSRHSVSVYWLKGRRSLEEWTGEMNKALDQFSLTQTDKYTGTSMDDTFTIADDNNYYLGFTSVAGDTRFFEVSINFTVGRIIYDTRSYTAVCNASAGESCQVQLRFNSNDTAVIEVEDSKTVMFPLDVWTSWYCQPRIWMYFCIFGGIFLLAVSVLFLIYFCTMSKVNKRSVIQKPSQIPSRTESFNMHAVILRSIDKTESVSNDNCENSGDSTPLNLIPNNRDASIQLDQRDADEVTCNNRKVSAAMTSRDVDVNSQLSGTTPSPRWSTFLQDPLCEYEECVTTFDGSPSDTFDLIDNCKVPSTEEESNFENDLVDRLKRLKIDNNVVYDGPYETDIDDSPDDSCNESAFESFIKENNDGDEDVTSNLVTEEMRSEVVKRRRERRREPRWEPRLSMVTEV